MGAVLAGFTATLRLLGKRGLMPVLLLSTLLGCGAFVLCILAMQFVNYLGWGWFAPLF